MSEVRELSNPSDVVEPDAARLRLARNPSMSDVHVVPRSLRAARHELAAGDVLEGRYTLVSPLGEGGMGDVWLAHNPKLEMDVALKVLRVDERRDDLKKQMTQRLLMEARATAKLTHPAIVRIIDFGETPSGNGFYVMELLDGEDLGAVIARCGRLSSVKAVRTLLPIAGALAMAHGKNIVHRDLKPDNIFLARDRGRNTVQPKLIDFGIAKLSEVAERITVAGTLMGSPGYMAPEQTRGEDVDARADVWGFSIVLYETITGRLPFDGRNFFALARSIMEDEPAAILACEPGDDTLWSIIQRGLAKDPAKRWQSMNELGRALAHWLLERGVAEDISGSPLPASWLRETDSVEAPPSLRDPFVSAAVPAPVMDAAKRERAERPTDAPPPPSVIEIPMRRSPVWRSHGLAAAAVVLGVGCGIAGGAWGLSRTMADEPALGPEVAAAQAVQDPTAALAAPVEPASSGVAAPSIAETSSATVQRESQRRPRARVAPSSAKPADTVPASAPKPGAEPVRALSPLKNPFAD